MTTSEPLPNCRFSSVTGTPTLPVRHLAPTRSQKKGDNFFTFGSLFSGIGGLDLGLERSGMVCQWQVEINQFCRDVLKNHWPNVPKYEDVKNVGARNLKPVDLICGGFPCQDTSLAGQRLGFAGERSPLWFQYARIIREIKPRWVLVENVPGLLSSDDGEFFAEIQRELAQIGYAVEWDVLPASAFGAIHQRERVFIVAHADGQGLAQRRNILRPGDWPDDLSQKNQSAVGSSYLAYSKYLADARNWPCESVFLRANHGVPHRVDRITALGNAVVPQVAEWIGRRILEADNA